MEAPRIGTAIPRRRYQLGEFGVVILGDVESRDDHAYELIMALVREGSAQPEFYITCERNPPGERLQGSHRLRVIARGGEKVLGSASGLQNLDDFAEIGLAIARESLNLGDEQAVRLG